jgi:hypothetical protein
VTTPNEIEEAIENAAKAFQGASSKDEREKGFESTELPAEEVQMRKGCRALTLVQELLPNGTPGDLTYKRYYTAAIELSFNVIERSCQAALISTGHLNEDEHHPHTVVLKTSHRAGHWDPDAAAGLANVYKENRSKFYYREGVPSETRAKRMLDVAKHLHHHLAEQDETLGDTCLCDQ